MNLVRWFKKKLIANFIKLYIYIYIYIYIYTHTHRRMDPEGTCLGQKNQKKKLIFGVRFQTRFLTTLDIQKSKL